MSDILDYIRSEFRRLDSLDAAIISLQQQEDVEPRILQEYIDVRNELIELLSSFANTFRNSDWTIEPTKE